MLDQSRGKPIPGPRDLWRSPIIDGKIQGHAVKAFATSETPEPSIVSLEKADSVARLFFKFAVRSADVNVEPGRGTETRGTWYAWFTFAMNGNRAQARRFDEWLDLGRD